MGGFHKRETWFVYFLVLTPDPCLGHQRGKAISVHVVEAVFLQELGTSFIKIAVERSEDRSTMGL